MLTLLAIFSYILALLLLTALAWRDLQEYILPNKMNAALALTFGAFHISTGWQIVTPQEAVLGALAGGGMLLAIGLAADHFYKKDSLGMGDVKLMAAAGIGLGFPDIMLAMSAGAFAAMLHGCVMAIAQERRTGEKVNLGEINVPAGLGLAAGVAIVMVTQFGFSWTGTP